MKSYMRMALISAATLIGGKSLQVITIRELVRQIVLGNELTPNCSDGQSDVSHPFVTGLPALPDPQPATH